MTGVEELAILAAGLGAGILTSTVGVASLLSFPVLVALARVYVGAHLPLDVVGGAALGVAVAAGVHLALGRPPGWRPGRPLLRRVR